MTACVVVNYGMVVEAVLRFSFSLGRLEDGYTAGAVGEDRHGFFVVLVYDWVGHWFGKDCDRGVCWERG